MYSILVFTKNPKVCWLVLGFVFRFCCSPFVRALRLKKKTVTQAAVPHRIECCCAFKNRLLLFEQHSHFVRRRSRASGYRRPCSSRVWSASRVGTLPSFLRAGRRLYRSWTVHQCWCSTSTVDSFSFWILAFVCQAYPVLNYCCTVLHPRFRPFGF